MFLFRLHPRQYCSTKLNMAGQHQLPSGQDRVHYDLTQFGLPEIPVLGIHDETRARPGLHPHAHPGTMEICYLTRGERIYHVNRHDYPFRGNEVFVTYPGEVHGSGRHPHGKGRLYWLQVRLPPRPAPFLTLAGSNAWPLVRRLQRLPHRRFLGDRRLQTLFEEMIELVLNDKSDLARLEISTRLIQWLLLVVRCAEAESERRVTPDIRRVLDSIDATLDQAIRVDALAEMAQLSTSRFKVKFKEQVGLPPAEYAIRRKVERAREWLKQGKSVTDVAFDLGFSTSQYFATTFKRITNQRPRDV